MADVTITRLPDNVVQVVVSTGTIVTRGSVAALAADPTSPYEGQVWFNTTDDALRYYDGTATVTVGTLAGDAGTLDGQAGTYYLSRANHTGVQTIATITGLQAALDAKASTSSLTAGLAGKSNLGHGHTAGDVSNFNTSVDARITKAKVDSLGVNADTLDGVDSTGFATAAQGALADSASQPGHDHDGTFDPAGTGASEAAAAVVTHEGGADPHAGYQLETQKGQANGYAGLGAGGLVPPAQLGTGTADDTVYLRGDGTYAEPPGAGGAVTDHGSLTGLADDDHTVYLRTDGTRPLTGNLSAGGNQINDAFLGGGSSAAANNQIQLRADDAASWASNNPVLAINELAFEGDTRKFKIGDGSTAWNDLPYRVDKAFVEALGIDVTEAQITDLAHFTTSDANAAIDARVDKAFVEAFAVDADTVDGVHAAGLLDRAAHTGTQTASTISDLSPTVQALVDASVDALLDGAPGALDTLNELAAAIGDDADFAGTVTAALAAKLDAAAHDTAAHDTLGINAATVDGHNAADLLDRTLHIGTQTHDTISDFDTEVQAIVDSNVGGDVWHVNPDGGDDGNTGGTADPYATVNAALAAAQPGDTILLEPGFYDQDVTTVRAGLPGAPIRIVGTHDAVIRGGTTTTRTCKINHSHVWIDGVTFDGLHTPGAPGSASSYRNKMVYVVPPAEDGSQYLEGVRLLNLVVRNCLDEGVRVRFTNHFEVGYCRIHDVGKDDYVFAGGGDNGEGVYIGTSPSQLSGSQVDFSHGFHVHHLDCTDFNGSEAVNTKEGTYDGLIEHVTATTAGQATVGAINVQGRLTTVQYCDLHDNSGSGVRVGEATAPLDGSDAGDSCTIRHNRVVDNGDWGLKIVTTPQTEVCGNVGSGNVSGFETGFSGGADACAITAAGSLRGWVWQQTVARLDQLAAPTVAVSMGGQRVVSTADPVDDQDVATRAWVLASTFAGHDGGHADSTYTINVDGGVA